MSGIVKKLALSAAGLFAAFGAAVPAQAYYVIGWSNSYGGGIAWYCDSGVMTKSEGVVEIGDWYVIEWAPNDPFCPPE